MMNEDFLTKLLFGCYILFYLDLGFRGRCTPEVGCVVWWVSIVPSRRNTGCKYCVVLPVLHGAKTEGRLDLRKWRLPRDDRHLYQVKPYASFNTTDRRGLYPLHQETSMSKT